MARVSDPAKVALWRERFARRESSGMSVKEFCVAEGITVPSFYAWRRKLGLVSVRPRKSSRPSAFEQVILHAPPTGLTVHLPGGVQIEMPCVSDSALRAVIGELVRASRLTAGESTPC
jgi:hypothetical protein